MFDLTGKVAVITGSSRGIGRAIAEDMARQGAKVVVSSRKAEACEKVAAGIREAGGEAAVIPCHVGRKAQIENLLAETISTYGGLDILVCNAASNPYFGPMAGISDEIYQKIMDNNVRSNFWLCNMAAPRIAERGGGAIIIISSVEGSIASRTLGVYGISKAADLQIGRSMAAEWGHEKVRVNCIAPGLVKTDFARALWENESALKAVNAKTPLGRIGDPSDISGVAVFLASDQASFLTGQTITVDGGMTMGQLS